MEHLDPIETARRILAGESLVENNIVEDEVDEIVVEDFEDLDIEEVEEMAHGNKKKMKKEEDDEDDDDDDDVEEAMHPMGKNGKKKLNATYGKMNATYGKMNAGKHKMNAGMHKMKEAETVVDDEAQSQDTEGKKPQTAKPVGNASGKNQSTIKTKPSKAKAGKIPQNQGNVGDVGSMKEHVDALFTGEALSEDFKVKALTIFETALNERAAQVEEELTLQYEEAIAEHTEAVSKELAEKLDDYLSYVVEQWMQENELAIETGIRADVAENFLSGLKGLFESNYIEVPEEKYDLVESLAQTVVDLEEKLNDELNYNIELKQTVEDKTRVEIFVEVTVDLVDTDTEKMRTLSENLEFTDEDSFRSKLEVLKDNYLSEGVLTEDTEVSTSSENSDTGYMSAYTEALTRVAKSANDSKVS